MSKYETLTVATFQGMSYRNSRAENDSHIGGPYWSVLANQVPLTIRREFHLSNLAVELRSCETRLGHDRLEAEADRAELPLLIATQHQLAPILRHFRE